MGIVGPRLCLYDALGTPDAGLGEPFVGHDASALVHHVQLARGVASFAGPMQRIEERGNQVVRSVGDDAAGVQRVAHLAIQGVEHRVGEVVRVG